MIEYNDGKILYLKDEESNNTEIIYNDICVGELTKFTDGSVYWQTKTIKKEARKMLADIAFMDFIVQSIIGYLKKTGARRLLISNLLPGDIGKWYIKSIWEERGFTIGSKEDIPMEVTTSYYTLEL